MKTTQKAVMMWRKALWTPLVFLSSSICPQMSQRVVILRTIVRHPFQCLLASQFDDIHLWGRIIAFSTCITVIGPLCSPQSIQRPNIKLKMLCCQKWRFWWILLEQIVYSKSKEEKANSPILMEFATLYTQYPWHYCSYCHNRTKEIYKDNHNCVFTIVSKNARIKSSVEVQRALAQPRPKRRNWVFLLTILCCRSSLSRFRSSKHRRSSVFRYLSSIVRRWFRQQFNIWLL